MSSSTTFQCGLFVRSVVQYCGSYSTAATWWNPAISKPRACPPPPAQISIAVRLIVFCLNDFILDVLCLGSFYTRYNASSSSSAPMSGNWQWQIIQPPSLSLPLDRLWMDSARRYCSHGSISHHFLEENLVKIHAPWQKSSRDCCGKLSQFRSSGSLPFGKEAGG